MIKEFREFIMRGNVIDLAVGIIIGAAFTAIVTSLVSDIITPVLGLALGGVDFSNIFITLRDGTVAGPYATLAAAQEAGAVTINVGVFLDALISFLIVAFVVFLLVRGVNRLMTMRKKQEAAEEAAKPDPAAEREERLIASINRLTETMEKRA
jgi:large conductance mechanosensitive channel